jgi:hypothetical protein
MDGTAIAIAGLFVTTLGQLIGIITLIWKGGRWTASVEGKLIMLNEKITDGIHRELEDHEVRVRDLEKCCHTGKGFGIAKSGG